MILETLKQKSQSCNDKINIPSILHNIATEITENSTSQLKKIIEILPEYDNHDSDHSKNIIKYIEEILGEVSIKKLNKYELFLIYTSAYLHDIGMSLSDWEINLLDKIEDLFIKNKFQKTFSTEEAINFITQNKDHIYRDFNIQCEAWYFGFKDEINLIEYLAKQCIDYQKVRNFENKSALNSSQIKSIFIRNTHNHRSSIYVNNLKNSFKDKFNGQSWAEKLCLDLAEICELHCKDINEIGILDRYKTYIDHEECDLQLIAMLLRIGDILDFSYNRAPRTLQDSRIFESDYSLKQWNIKNESVNIYIKDNTIYFCGYFKVPEYYYRLHNYIDWVDFEIKHLNNKILSKNNEYEICLSSKVNRDKIDYDKNIFEPKIGIKFSIDNNKVLQLLMSTGLYKDEFACLRELYQNSIDACNYRYEKFKKQKIDYIGEIEFGIDKINDKSVLYCYDNGIGMDKNIIENYLLNIGNSYYSSKDFYIERSYWNTSFEPISKFGIGILSCFMLGNKLEIVTKKDNSDYISFVIDKSNEYFYYKHTTNIDKERIKESGTIIKIFLNSETSDMICDYEIEKLGFYLCSYKPHSFQTPKELRDRVSNWEKHIYHNINKFIVNIPNHTYVNVKDCSGKMYPILSKPLALNNHKLMLEKEDYKLFNMYEFDKLYGDDSLRAFECTKLYILEVHGSNYNYRFSLQLPLNNFTEQDEHLLDLELTTGERNLSLNGIIVTNYFSTMNNVLQAIQFNGIINFVGNNVPEISIDRSSFPKLNEDIIDTGELADKISDEVIKAFTDHIKQYHFVENSYLYNVTWNYIIKNYSFLSHIFLKKIGSSDLSNVQWNKLNDITSENLSLNEFINKSELTLNYVKFYDLSYILQDLIEFKLTQADKIVLENSSIIISNKSGNNINYSKRYKKYRSDYNELIIKTDDWNGVYNEYDIVTGLGPIVPKRLFDKISTDEFTQIHHDRFCNIPSFSNGLGGILSQDPVLINPEMGFYNYDSSFRHEPKSKIFKFDKRIKNIHLGEINSDSKNINLLYAYISPRTLTIEEEEELQCYENSKPSYVQGVREGWSVLFTTLNSPNLIIKPGIKSRKDLLSDIDNIFELSNPLVNFRFLDGTNVNTLF